MVSCLTRAAVAPPAPATQALLAGEGGSSPRAAGQLLRDLAESPRVRSHRTLLSPALCVSFLTCSCGGKSAFKTLDSVLSGPQFKRLQEQF